MKPTFYPPSFKLRHFVGHVMISEAQFTQELDPVALFPATPQQCIYFYARRPIKIRRYGENDFVQLPKSVVVAAQVNRINIQMGGHHLTICVTFKPGMLHHFLGCPIVELKDVAHHCDLFFGSEMASVNQQLEDATNHAEILQIVEAFIWNRVSTLHYHPIPFDYALQKIVSCNGLLSIDKAAAIACLSNRQFERYFLQKIGISPKFFSRIVRFSKAYRLKENNPSLNWGTIAHQCGYFDQMHLVKDFKQFAGVTPNVLSQEILKSGIWLQKDMLSI